MTSPLRHAAQVLTLILSCIISPFVAAAAAPDAGLYTGYVFSGSYSSVSFFVCGSVPGSSGCYGSGSLGPFGHAGAMLESGARTVGNAVSHTIYVVDVAGGASGTDVVLYRYLLTNTVQPPYDSVTYKLTKKLTLPLTGGANVRCSLASNAGFLFIGTDQSTSVVRVAKTGFALNSFGGFSNNPTVAAITTDAHGFVIVSFGANGGIPGGGHIDFGPTGDPVADGGGAWFTAPSNQGISTKELPTD